MDRVSSCREGMYLGCRLLPIDVFHINVSSDFPSLFRSPLKSMEKYPQVVKPHTPLIRFPNRRDNPKLDVSEAVRSTGVPSHSSSISQHSKGSKSSDWLMHQGPPDTAEIIKTLPQKYRRKPVSQEEVEYIQVCC
ncbi:28S ribosomal protein S36, mitochondrial [Myotis davidii]|uniref:28S ribosomal protein S36, mitochondrial n=1 Tax=Myotis davidii TaxID=225400 RepID=L5LYT3_MYODS|nr:28S ribosomal protein S36, mitochondrial [Myotis davidii]